MLKLNILLVHMAQFWTRYTRYSCILMDKKVIPVLKDKHYI